jgi:hypothetical protein
MVLLHFRAAALKRGLAVFSPFKESTVPLPEVSGGGVPAPLLCRQAAYVRRTCRKRWLRLLAAAIAPAGAGLRAGRTPGTVGVELGAL